MTYEQFSAPLDLGFPEEWYAMSGEKHFWLQWRMRVLRRLLADHSIPLKAPLHVLEVGCGTGVLRSGLERISGWTIDGADINAPALACALPARGRTLLYNVHDRHPRFLRSYDAVIAFDVLEHIEDPGPFMQSAFAHLKPGGFFLINVPACAALYSRYDEIVGHHRRYSSKSLSSVLQEGIPDVDIIDIRYWGFSLLPLLWLRKRILRRMPADHIVSRGFRPPTPWINSALLAPMMIETFALHHPPAGTSLMGLARIR